MRRRQRVRSFPQVRLREAAIRRAIVRFHPERRLQRADGGSDLALGQLQQTPLDRQVEIDLLLVQARTDATGRRTLELYARLGKGAAHAERAGELDADVRTRGIELCPASEHVDRLRRAACVKVGCAERQIGVRLRHAGANHLVQLTDGFITASKVTKCEPHIVASLQIVGIGRGGLSRQLQRASRVAKLPLDVAEKRQDLRIAGCLRERLLQLGSRAIEPPKIAIAVGEVQPRRRLVRVDRERLPEFRHRLGDEFLGAEGAIGDAEGQMGVA